MRKVHMQNSHDEAYAGVLAWTAAILWIEDATLDLVLQWNLPNEVLSRTSQDEFDSGTFLVIAEVGVHGPGHDVIHP